MSGLSDAGRPVRLGLYADWRAAPWDAARWPNFTPAELACRASGEFFMDPAAFDALQALRNAMRSPVRVTSGHRSAAHNAAVGGARASAHLRFAADIALEGHEPGRLLRAAEAAGFTSIGLYVAHIHVDRRLPARRWYGPDPARVFWRRWL